MDVPTKIRIYRVQLEMVVKIYFGNAYVLYYIHIVAILVPNATFHLISSAYSHPRNDVLHLTKVKSQREPVEDPLIVTKNPTTLTMNR